MSDPAVIVGAGQAGAHAALAMRQAGFAGRILLIGDEAEHPHERPPLSKAMLTAEQEPPVAYFHPASHYAGHGIELLPGTTVTRIEPDARTLLLADGRQLAWGSLLLATGGRARRLAVPGGELVSTLRTLDDARLLRGRLRPGARVVCVGAGVIGLEIASSARARGCAVTVVEVGLAVMGANLARNLASREAGLHRAAGVTLLLGTGVAEVTPETVTCTDGTRIACDVVIAGIGMQRSTALARDAGLAVDDGIEVDEFGRTSVAGIHAAGDVAAFWVPRTQRRLRSESWRHAQNHGAAVGRAMAGAGAPYDEVAWFWTDQHGRNLQLAGTAAGAVGAVMRGSPGAAPFSAWYLDAAGRLTGVVGVDAPREVRAAQVLIQAARPVDPRLLADPTVTPQRLARV